ncbi:TonB-dependent receptor [Sphingopyxis sp.]|uniref:TonB-dependent receptor n=1 Tax=Sphingopyxis sp. TaxID=1908224 RepID=UPI001E131DA4|nr:TonB-dependent receptor [Sphingopyxis sp.]MBW8297178.1 TonB-dependent receptor [Sphingopyxis sp.]
MKGISTTALRRIFSSASLISIAVLPCAAYGQNAGEAEQAGQGSEAVTADAPGQDRFDTIVVTAERRESTAQRTPIAITALGGENLQSSGITNIEGLNDVIPNLSFQRNAGDARIFIRGIGYNSISPGGETRVALYSDNVYQSRTQAGLLGFYDVDRVEVLRGPQGTLYGRNAIAGTINILTRDPGLTFNGYGSTTVGTYGLLAAEGAVGVRLSDTLGARLAVRAVNREGFGENLTSGADVGDERSISSRLRLIFEPSSAVEIRLTGDYSRVNDRSGGYRYGGPGNFNITPLGFILGGPDSVPRDVQDSASFGPRQEIETYGIALDAEFELGGNTTLNLISAYRSLDARLESNVDGFVQELTRQYISEKSELFTQEVRIAHSFGEFADIIVGGYYFHESNSALNEVPHKAIVLQQPGSPFAALVAGRDPVDLIDFFATFGDVGTDAFAAFAQADIHLTDKLELSLGARYSTEKKNIFEGRQLDVLSLFEQGDSLRPDLDPANGLFGGGPLGAGFREQEETWSSFDPKITLSYQATPDTLFYATFSQGFKSGGFNLGGLQAPFRPESLTNYEIGVKTDMFDDLVRANVSAFRYDYEDLQQNIVIGNNLITRNAAEARLYGAEAEITIRPTDALTLDLNGAYLHGEYREFESVNPSQPELGLQDLRGNQLANAPRWQIGGNIGYEIVTDVGSFTPRANVTWFDEVFFTEFNVAELRQPSRTMVNLFLTWEADATDLTVTAYVRNLLDDDYYSNKATSNGLLGFPNTAQFGEPLTAGVTVTKRF